MTRRTLIAPSLLAADFARPREEAAAAEAAGADWLHLDVMDGHFVPNISFGPLLIRALRPHCRLPFDVHLMIAPVDPYIAAFAEAGANWMSVHYEACRHLHRSLELIAHHGMKPGVVINPATPVEVIVPILSMVHHVLVMSVNPGFGGQSFIPFSLTKIQRLKELRHELGLSYRIEVDGGIAHDTIALVVEAGAELLVAGNAVFGAGNPERDARSLLRAARDASALS